MGSGVGRTHHFPGLQSHVVVAAAVAAAAAVVAAVAVAAAAVAAAGGGVAGGILRRDFEMVPGSADLVVAGVGGS